VVLLIVIYPYIYLTRSPIQLQFNSKIGLRLNWIESNSIEEKWDANLWRKDKKYIYEYGVGFFLKKRYKCEKTFDFMPLYLGMG
jgi:hypothetical protein